MKIPQKIQLLIHEGLIDQVVGQLMSGKEASVFVVHAGGELRCAKVYKEANHRSFKHNTQYTEGRRDRSSRRVRAMGKKSRYGRQELEGAWQNAEVEALASLAQAGVRVPKVFAFMNGVLLMELVIDAHGDVAPRLHEVELSVEEARRYHSGLISEVVRMLCAGIIHGDLSEFNILLGADGPVIIDLPQAVNSAGNNNAFKILERDVANLARFFGRFAPELLQSSYAKEIWNLYKSGKLQVDSQLTGRYVDRSGKVNVDSVMQVIDDARDEAMKRQGNKT